MSLLLFIKSFSNGQTSLEGFDKIVAMKTTWSIILVVVAIIGLVFFVARGEDKAVTTDEEVNTSVPQNSEGNADSSMAIEEAAPFEQANLVAVGSYTGNGTATRTTEGRFIHEVVASLGDPAPGDFYEGWLVGPSVVSTGKLAEESEGEWSLVFESNDDLSQHNTIVITEETEANGLDGIPEDHVLEGSF